MPFLNWIFSLFPKKSRSPALKPLWLSLAGSDAETLFSGLFRKFFCHASRDYFAGLSAAKETHLDGKVVPAYLLHIKDLAIALRYGKSNWIFLAIWSFDHFQLFNIHSFSDPMFLRRFEVCLIFLQKVAFCQKNWCGSKKYSKASRYAVFGFSKKQCSSNPQFMRFIPKDCFETNVPL